MADLMKSQSISISIARSPEKVFEFAADPDTMNVWGKFRIESMRMVGDLIYIDTARGSMRVEPLYRKDQLVLDEIVRLDPFEETLLAQRIVPNSQGAEYMITLFQPERMSDDVFAKCIKWMEAALMSLKQVMEKGGAAGARLMPCHIINISIDRDPGTVFEFVSQPESLPQWARVFCRYLEPHGNDWYVHTPQGRVSIRFQDYVDTGVIDQFITPENGPEMLVPMRVTPNNAGTEVIFTLFQPADISDMQFEIEKQWVRRDLGILNDLLRLRGFEKAA